MKQTILGLRAETSIHAGTGQNSGIIDMPIQREAHTNYPCIFGSAVKGAFRAHAEIRAAWGKGGKTKKVFGSADQDGNASPIAMTDARLLLLPVRSLTGHFKLVTCPAILKRLQGDMLMMGMKVGWSVPVVEAQQVCSGSEGDIFLEEFKFQQVNTDLSAIIASIESFGVENIDAQFLIMDNDDFAWFAKNATAVTPHIAIDSETKIVKTGALWYEETLPSDALLYTMLMGKKYFVDQVIDMFKDKPFVQIGGNETVGMGWCKVREVSHV
ncbi:MAG: type III-B CRISPR module RAMP protein Cmr4 [Ghiorsea sp.]|nr:type III-B CRISPR module RAMP protein Cmr4 [Ghiorsea sp.]